MRPRQRVSPAALDVPRPRARRDGGSAPAVLLAALAATALALGALGALSRVTTARSRAQAAADLSALAAAQVVAMPGGLVLAAGVGPPDAACGRAREVADRNGATVTACRVAAGGVVDVTARATSPLGDASTSARAGPRPAGP